MLSLRRAQLFSISDGVPLIFCYCTLMPGSQLSGNCFCCSFFIEQLCRWSHSVFLVWVLSAMLYSVDRLYCSSAFLCYCFFTAISSRLVGCWYPGRHMLEARPMLYFYSLSSWYGCVFALFLRVYLYGHYQ